MDKTILFYIGMGWNTYQIEANFCPYNYFRDFYRLSYTRYTEQQKRTDFIKSAL